MSLGSTEPTPDNKALTLITHEHLGDVYLMSAFTYARSAHLKYVSKTFPVRCQIEIY